MKAFRFRLEKLRELRVAEEETQARMVAAARAAVDQALEMARQVGNAESEVRERIAAAIGRSPSVGTVQNLRVLLNHLMRQRQAAEADHRKAEESLEESLIQFREAIREREVLDRLKDRQKEQWALERRRIDQNTLDEQSRGDRVLSPSDKGGGS